MKRVMFLIIVLILFSGCSSKDNEQIVNSTHSLLISSEPPNESVESDDSNKTLSMNSVSDPIDDDLNSDINDTPCLFVTGCVLLGGHVGDSWIDAKEAEAYVSGKEKFKFYSFDKSLGEGNNAKMEWYDDGASINMTRSYPISYSDDNFFIFYMDELGISGDWNALPRTPYCQESNLDIYEQVVGDILENNGVNSPVVIKKVIRIDLDGDTTEEVLITATDWDIDTWYSSILQKGKGTYSIVLLRKIVNGEVENIIIKQQYAKDKPESEYVYYTPFILDVDNDGEMEVIVEGLIYAWSKIDFYKIEESNVKEIFTTAFGA